MRSSRAFTLIELLVVIAIIAIISIVLILILNPAEYLNRSRDANRLSDMDTMVHILAISQVDSNIALGSSSVVYVSVPDPLATSTAGTQCQGLGLIAIPASTTYHCAASSTFRKTDGTGWIPVNFSLISAGNPISALPVDPQNITSTGQFYEYMTDGNHYEITSLFQSTKYRTQTMNDGGAIPFLFEQGTSKSLVQEDYGCANGGPCVWVPDASNNRVQKFDANGTYLSQFGSAGAGNGQLNSPRGVTVDTNGNVYVADTLNSRVQKFDSNGNYLSQFGSTGSGNGQFSGPAGIAIDASGNIYVVDDNIHDRVEKFDANGNYLLQFGSSGSGAGQFSQPYAIALDSSGNAYVTDTNNCRVEKFSPSGAFISQFGSCGTGNGQFNVGSAFGIAIGLTGKIYVTDQINARVEIFDANGNYLSQFGSGHLSCPEGVSVDANGIIYVSDSCLKNIQKFDANGTYLSQFGGSGTGSGQFNGPDLLFVR